MPKFVRVRLENGAEASVTAGFARSHKLKTVKAPAVDGRGRPLPVTFPETPDATSVRFLDPERPVTFEPDPPVESDASTD